MLQLHGGVEVVGDDVGLVWRLGEAGHQGHGGGGDLVMDLMMDWHRKLVVHSYRNLMVAPMMYSYTGT